MTIRKILVLAALLFSFQTSSADILLLHAEGSDADPFVTNVQTALGGFGLGNIDILSATTGTPTLAQLSSYDAVFAWTNFIPADGVALGNVLADYVDAGGGLLLNTYSYSNPWSIGGRMQTNGYSPLVNNSTNGDPGSILNALVMDAIFDGVNLANVIDFTNGNYALPGLDVGATLLADNGAGINMIARNAMGNIIGMNIFPGLNTNADAARLYANALLSVQRVPEPGTLSLLGLGLIALGLRQRRKKTLA